MKSPSCYRGYGEEGQLITIKYAEDATTYLNPASVNAKVNNVSTVMEEQITIIQNALRDLLDDANQAIIVNNTSMAPQIEELSEALETFKSTPATALETVYADSITVHDNIQDQLNQRARDSVAGTQGVVRIS